jgi:hypothetical protein
MLVATLLVCLGSMSGCGSDSGPEGALSADDLVQAPVYDTQITVYGQVSLLGELFCSCFELSSGGEKIMVWYATMVDDNGTEWPGVSVEGVQNGDQVVVTGELQRPGGQLQTHDLWATTIEKSQ